MKKNEDNINGENNINDRINNNNIYSIMIRVLVIMKKIILILWLRQKGRIWYYLAYINF